MDQGRESMNKDQDTLFQSQYFVVFFVGILIFIFLKIGFIAYFLWQNGYHIKQQLSQHFLSSLMTPFQFSNYFLLFSIYIKQTIFFNQHNFCKGAKLFNQKLYSTKPSLSSLFCCPQFPSGPIIGFQLMTQIQILSETNLRFILQMRRSLWKIIINMKFLALISALLIAASSQDVTTQTVVTEKCVSDRAKQGDWKNFDGQRPQRPEGEGFGRKGDLRGQGQQGGRGGFGGPGGHGPRPFDSKGFGQGPPKIDTTTLTAEQKTRYDELETALVNWRAVYTPPERPEFKGPERHQFKGNLEAKTKTEASTAC